MQKNILFFLTLFFSFISLSAQEDYYGNTLSSNAYSASQILGSTVQPPDVAAFQKVNFMPVSNYTGRVNINVPIYEVSIGAMNVPISLSYNSSGVKVSDMASNVGLNWSLNAGGMVSRIIKGMDDFHYSKKANSTVSYMTPAGWLHFTNNTPLYRLNRTNDAQPDLFVANAPGLSTKYIHKRQYVTNSDGTVSLLNTTLNPVELEQQGNIINETKTGIFATYGSSFTRFDNIEITSNKGIVYSFVSPDISLGKSAIFGGDYSNNYVFQSQRLNNMYDPSSNQTITFEYEEYASNFYDLMPPAVSSYGDGTYLQINGDASSYTYFPVTQRLTKITFAKGSIEFIYGLDRLDNTTEKALTEIKVKDINGTVVKHVKLSYSYFQSSIDSTTPQSKRLRLDRIYEIDSNFNELPGYVFTYNTTYQMPPRNSYAHDFLGYNNGSYNSSITNPVPKLYFKDNKVTPFYDTSAIELTGNYSLEANENYAKTYSLTKITFPTGGYNEYEYELNSFNYNGVKNGGGLRIKSQKLVDQQGNEQILDYTYENGSIANMPEFALFRLKQGTLGTPTSLSQLTSYLGIDTFRTPQSQIEFTQGSFVGYGTVTVQNRINNGYVVYTFSTPSSYPNTSPSITYPYEINNWPTHSWSLSWGAINPKTLYVDNDYLRGKLLFETTYTDIGKKRLYKRYFYTQKEFSSIPLTYFSKSSTEPNSTCYNEDQYVVGYYDSDQCGGFYEEIDIPIARDVLTTIITEDYQSENLVSNPQGFENLPHTLQTTQTFTYDKQYPLVTNESKAVTVCVPTIQGGEQLCENVYDNYSNLGYSKTVTYPIKGGTTMQDNVISSLPYATELVTANRLSVPLNIKYYGLNLMEEGHIYKDFGNNIIATEKINFIDRNNIVSPSDKITKRDVNGNILEYLSKDNVYHSFIYGYNNTTVIAKINNASNTDIPSSLYSSIVSKSDMDDSSLDEDLLRAELNKLRNSVYAPNLSNALITTYTYDPLIGVTSITDPKGYTTYYEYDAFNRLRAVKDADGNILSQNEYHYKNQ